MQENLELYSWGIYRNDEEFIVQFKIFRLHFLNVKILLTQYEWMNDWAICSLTQLRRCVQVLAEINDKPWENLPTDAGGERYASYTGTFVVP